MATMTLTTIGLYNYDPTLFSGLNFPTGIDKDIAVNEILMRSGEFEVLYPNLDFFKYQISMWGKKHYRTFEKWVNALSIEYDPLYNYDRTEEYTDTRTGTNQTMQHGSENMSSDDSAFQQVLNDSEANTKTSGERGDVSTESHSQSGTAEHQRSAYDSSTYSPESKDITSASNSDNVTAFESQNTSSDSSGSSNTATTDLKHGKTAREQQNATSGVNQEEIKHTAHLYGNIGVTTSQQMLKDELEIDRFNIYENIADLFVDEFCIMVY